MENRNVTLLVGAFVALIIGISLIGIIASSTNTVTERTTVIEESHAATGCWVRVNMSTTTEDGPIWAQVDERAGKFTNASCNFSVTNAPTGWKQSDCLLASVVVRNATSGYTALTLDTDYALDTKTGIVSLINTTATRSWLNTSNNTLVSYTYCDDSYLNNSFGRSVTDLIAGFFALALLLISVGLFYQVMKNEGLANL